MSKLILTLLSLTMTCVITVCGKNHTHLVVLHGINDNCFDGFAVGTAERLCNLTTTETHKTTSTCLKLGPEKDLDQLWSNDLNMDLQVRLLCENLQYIQIDEDVDKVVLVGLSQGGLQARTLFAYCPDALPNGRRFDTFISVGGPQMGVFGINNSNSNNQVYI